MLFSSFLIKVTFTSFSLIKKWNYNIWILNYMILIFKLLDFDFYECYATMFEYFTRELAWVANDSWNPVCQRLFIFQHVLLAWPILRVGTRELVMKSSFSQNLHQTLTHNLYIKSYKKYKEMIEHNYNQIWHGIKTNKKHSCKSQFTKLLINCHLWFFFSK